MKKILLIICLWLPCNFSLASSALVPSFAPIVENLLPTVVNVFTTQTIKKTTNKSGNHGANPFKNSPFEPFFKEFFEQNKQNKDKKIRSLGSGFFISNDGFVITNAHVVDGADKIEVKLHDGSTHKAKLIGSDKKSDIAVLKVNIKGKNFPFVKFGNSDKKRVGDWVIAIGNPFGLGGTVTAGIISARGRNISDGSNTDFIQTDAAINKGNSGGPMFDLEGDLIGINTAIFSNNGGSVGIGFAIPVQTALPIIKQLKEKGAVTRGWLGVNIQFVSNEIADALGFDKPIGAYVVGLAQDGPAKKSGLKVDDLIIEFDGKEIKTMYELPRIVGATPIKKKVKVVVLRLVEGKFIKKDIFVEIGELKSAKKTEKKELAGEDIFGLKLANLSEELRNKYKIEKSVTGILVLKSDNQDAPLLAGDVITKVNQIKITSVAKVKKLISFYRKQGRKHILLSVTRNGDSSLILPLEITK